MSVTDKGVAYARDPLVRMERISKRFGAIQALDKADFEVNSAEIVGLVGDNGAGKSTPFSDCSFIPLTLKWISRHNTGVDRILWPEPLQYSAYFPSCPQNYRLSCFD